MNENLTAIKGTACAICSAIGAFLGWKGIMAMVWIVMMIIDYGSGTAAACKAGEWSSARAREGLWHKAGMILVVIVAAIGDGIMTVIIGNIPLINMEWPGFLLPLVLAWYIITEAGSILENAVKMGANVPAWLVKILKASLKAVDTAGDTGLPDDNQNNK